MAFSAFAQDCTLVVPPHPLTATGLATPYQLTATDPANPCHELDPTQSAFVQAAIFDPATGQVSLYTPLVIDAGTQPAVPPVMPVLPDHAIVAVWFGYNGLYLSLNRGAKRRIHLGGEREDFAEGRCVNGLGASDFGQFAYCNAPRFFEAANAAIRSGRLVVPPLGTGLDGQPCPTTRSFAEVDQDPSDNLPVSYLNINGLVAQYNTTNAAIHGAVKFGNPSDERLVPILLDPPLGCVPFTAPELSNGGIPAPALALNELHAAAHQAPPIALIPLEDEMVLVDNETSVVKMNLYRVGVDQPPSVDRDPVKYCSNFRSMHPQKLELDKAFFAVRPSPFPNMANSLFTFMAQRYVASYTLLKCDVLLNLPVNESLTTDANGVVIDAVYTP